MFSLCLFKMAASRLSFRVSELEGPLPEHFLSGSKEFSSKESSLKESSRDLFINKISLNFYFREIKAFL